MYSEQSAEYYPENGVNVTQQYLKQLYQQAVARAYAKQIFQQYALSPQHQATTAALQQEAASMQQKLPERGRKHSAGVQALVDSRQRNRFPVAFKKTLRGLNDEEKERLLEDFQLIDQRKQVLRDQWAEKEGKEKIKELFKEVGAECGKGPVKIGSYEFSISSNGKDYIIFEEKKSKKEPLYHGVMTAKGLQTEIPIELKSFQDIKKRMANDRWRQAAQETAYETIRGGINGFRIAASSIKGAGSSTASNKKGVGNGIWNGVSSICKTKNSIEKLFREVAAKPGKESVKVGPYEFSISSDGKGHNINLNNGTGIKPLYQGTMTDQGLVDISAPLERRVFKDIEKEIANLRGKNTSIGLE